MSIVENVLKRFGYVRPQMKRNGPSFHAANTGRLYSSWTTQSYSADYELRTNLRTIRARSRNMANNNDYAKKFLRMVGTNVVGKDGVRLQSRTVNKNNKPDNLARKLIEEAWKEWSRKGNCDVTGEHSFRDIQRMAMRTMAMDGEVLIRKVNTNRNGFNFALQLLEADHLDEFYNDTLSNGNRIKMGIEFDSWGRRIAYHVYKQHPTDYLFSGRSTGERTRIPAEEIVHLFLPYRISQSRGLPWMHTALNRLQQLGAYEEAELIAARIAAAKGGFYERDGEGSTDGPNVDGEDDEGVPTQTVEPGTYEILPDGWTFKAFDPQHPTTQFGPFIKAMLRGVASGLDVSYNFLANDLEGVNFSSIRTGVLDERDVWRDLQCFLIEHALEPIFADWLPMALLNRKIDLPYSRLEKLQAVKWQPRGWQWVDPEKDIKAKILSVQAGFESIGGVVAEQGNDLEDIVLQQKDDQLLFQKNGLNPPSPQVKGKNKKAGKNDEQPNRP